MDIAYLFVAAVALICCQADGADVDVSVSLQDTVNMLSREIDDLKTSLQHIISHNKEEENRNQALVVQINRLENKNEDFAAKVGDLQRRNEDVTAKLSELENRNEDLEAKISEIEKKNESLTTSDIGELHDLIHRERGKEISSPLEKDKIKPCSAKQQSGIVAFSVSRTTSLDVTVDTPISFDIIHTNVGGGWQESNNYQFIVPVTGLYFFSYHARADDVSQFVGGDSILVINGINIVLAGGVNRYGGLSLSIVLHLSLGDEVYMALQENQAILSTTLPDVHFSGFLLHALII